MTTPSRPQREQPSTYFVQNRSDEEELSRLRIQDQTLTASMGGVLTEQHDPSRFHRILDVGSGSGSWCIEAAQTYPALSLIGIDISGRMIEYAKTQAVLQGVADRVTFQVMDALRMLEFPANFFDLTNLRLSASFMRTWDWPKMFSELQRITLPGGVIRITESNILHQSTSPAVTQLYEMFQAALAKAGHLFEPETTGITSHLASLFTQHGIEQVQTKGSSLEYRAGTPQGQAYSENLRYFFRTIRPFLQKWGSLSENYDPIYQQALQDMQQPDFYSVWTLLTVWGKKPE
jgi:ubiquinone/menaquinone biosynthesis C-methylase UbiE